MIFWNSCSCDSLLSLGEEPHFVVYYLLIYWNSLSGLQPHEVSSILRVFHVKLSCLVFVIACLGLCYCCIFWFIFGKVVGLVLVNACWSKNLPKLVVLSGSGFLVSHISRWISTLYKEVSHHQVLFFSTRSSQKTHFLCRYIIYCFGLQLHLVIFYGLSDISVDFCNLSPINGLIFFLVTWFSWF